MSLQTLALVILLAPFVAFLLNAFVARRAWALAGICTIVGVGVAFVASVLAFLQVQAGQRLTNFDFPWLRIGPRPGDLIEVGLRIDPLTTAMLLAVTGVSLLVQIYSWGYLHETELDAQGRPHVHRDPGFARYYTWMALFTTAMIGLVLASGLLTLFMFWELVGLCSYLLIGFWFQRPSAALAAKKAFLTTRLGDFGFMIGLFYIWSQTGTFNFSQLEALVAGHRIPVEVMTIGALLLFCGAAGKSAQFPLHVWLPDAMEGPTPVSALIHAATMVAAGVYLVARTFFLFEEAPVAMLVVAAIGGFTAVFAATMGLVNNDIKRVMAYSTLSQLGYMMLALGVGGLATGMFHLFAHAWFKALLFLTAGSVIHGTGGEQDMRRMGGLARKMPGTFAAMLIAGLALAGIPPLAGFWSKDALLGSITHFHDGPVGRALAATPAGQAFLPTADTIVGVLFALALLTVLMTAFYTGRVLFMTFGGRWRGDHHAYDHVHESPPVMLWPMLVLIVPTVLVGFWGLPDQFTNPAGTFYTFVERTFQPATYVAHEPFNPGLALGSVVLAIVGLVVAWAMYSARALDPARVTRLSGPLYGWAVNKWGFDDLYDFLVGKAFVGLAFGLALFDRDFLDGIVNGVASGTAGVGRALRGLQTGRVQTYAWVVVGGLVIVALAVVLPAIFGFRV